MLDDYPDSPLRGRMESGLVSVRRPLGRGRALHLGNGLPRTASSRSGAGSARGQADP